MTTIEEGISLVVTYTPACNAPTGLSTSASSSSSISLSWNAPTTCSPTGYGIYRESPTGSGFTKIVNDTGSSTTSYSDTGLTSGTQYNYKVFAWNSVGAGSNSTASATVTPTDVLVDVNYADGTALTSCTVTQTNSTTSETRSCNGSGQATFTALKNYQNFTVTETTDSFVVNKTLNFNATSTTNPHTLTINSSIFDVDCSQTGSSADVRLKINETDGHHITSYTTPTCNSSNVIHWNATFTADGNSGSTFNSTIIASILNTTAYGKDATQFLVNGTGTTTSYASSKITSESFEVGQGIISYLLKFYLTLDPKPDTPSLSASSASATSISLSWSGGTGVSTPTYNVYRSTDAVTYVLVTSTGSTSYVDTGLTEGQTYFYKVDATNSYGSSSNSTVANATPTQQQGGGSGGGGGGGSTVTTTTIDGLTLNFLPFSTKAFLGEIKTFFVSFTWDGIKNPTLFVKSVVIGSGDYDGITIVPEDIPIGGKIVKNGKSEIKVTVQIPQKECTEPPSTAKCANFKSYIIPLNIIVGDDKNTNYGPFPATLELEVIKQVPTGTATIIVVLMAASVSIAGIVARQSRQPSRPKTPKQHKKATERVLKKINASPKKNKFFKRLFS